MKEVWKDIPGYEGIYQVSILGRVKSFDRVVIRKNKPEYVLSGKVLKHHDNGKGYKTVSLCKNGKPKTTYIHRLVAELFVPNPNNLPEINHKDENKANNKANNLEWCSAKYNKNYGNRAKKFGISRGTPVMCVETGKIYYNCGEAGRKTGISRTRIWACCSGYRNTLTVNGQHWIFVEKK